MKTGRVDPYTIDQLKGLRRVGTIFRFKLYDREGRQLLVSDDLDRLASDPASGGGMLGDEHGEQGAVVKSLVLGGKNFIELQDGAGRPDRPASYSEAYVPLLRDGALLGVVEVYVDQTDLMGRAMRTLVFVALVVTAVLAVLGSIGAMQWSRRLRAQRRAEERVHYLAQHDVLSGALNRASFNDELERAAWRAEEGGSGFAVLCVDLDRFKEVNDTLGHAAGDEVLRQVAHRLNALLRDGDHVARLGGDEFAVLQTGAEGPHDVVDAGAAHGGVAGGAIPVRRPHDAPAAAASALRSTAPMASRPTSCCTGPIWRCTAPRARPRRLQLLRGDNWTSSCTSGAQLAHELGVGDRVRRHVAALPAAVRRRRRHADRLRGAGALAASDSRQRSAGRIHSAGRRDRADRAARPLVLRRACVEAATGPIR